MNFIPFSSTFYIVYLISLYIFYFLLHTSHLSLSYFHWEKFEQQHIATLGWHETYLRTDISIRYPAFYRKFWRFCDSTNHQISISVVRNTRREIREAAVREIFFSFLGTRRRSSLANGACKIYGHETRNTSPLCICITTRRGIKMKCLPDVSKHGAFDLSARCFTFQMFRLNLLKKQSIPVAGTGNDEIRETGPQTSSKQRRPRNS